MARPFAWEYIPMSRWTPEEVARLRERHPNDWDVRMWRADVFGDDPWADAKTFAAIEAARRRVEEDRDREYARQQAREAWEQGDVGRAVGAVKRYGFRALVVVGHVIRSFSGG